MFIATAKLRIIMQLLIFVKGVLWQSYFLWDDDFSIR